ncbi:hypothetical protein Agub_g4557, partial [Astrephomene gubernaculifera]
MLLDVARTTIVVLLIRIWKRCWITAQDTTTCFTCSYLFTHVFASLLSHSTQQMPKFQNAHRGPATCPQTLGSNAIAFLSPPAPNTPLQLKPNTSPILHDSPTSILSIQPLAYPAMFRHLSLLHNTLKFAHTFLLRLLTSRTSPPAFPHATSHCMSRAMGLGFVVSLLYNFSHPSRPLQFPLSCLSAVLAAVSLAVLSPDNHLGTRLLASANMMGGFAWGLVLAGIVLNIAHQVKLVYCETLVGCKEYTAVLCCMGVAVLAVLVTNRSALGAPYNPTVWLAGLVSVLGFGLALIAGQFKPDPRAMWYQDVSGLMSATFVASGLTGLISALVLPSLAVDELRADTAAAIRGIGHAASRFASRAMQPESQPLARGTSRDRPPATGASFGTVAATRPTTAGPQGLSGQHAPPHLHPHPHTHSQGPSQAQPHPHPHHNHLNPHHVPLHLMVQPRYRPQPPMRTVTQLTNDNDPDDLTERKKLLIQGTTAMVATSSAPAFTGEPSMPRQGVLGRPPSPRDGTARAAATAAVSGTAGTAGGLHALSAPMPAPPPAPLQPAPPPPPPLPMQAAGAVHDSDTSRPAATATLQRLASPPPPSWAAGGLFHPFLENTRIGEDADTMAADSRGSSGRGGHASTSEPRPTTPADIAAGTAAASSQERPEPDTGAASSSMTASTTPAAATAAASVTTRKSAAALLEEYAAMHSSSLPYSRRRLPGVRSYSSLDRLEICMPADADGIDVAGIAPAATSAAAVRTKLASVTPTSYASDDELSVWSRHADASDPAFTASNNLDFEHVLEDEDAFLRMLQESTAPHASPHATAHGGDARGKKAAAAAYARAPPVVVPAGGILPSPSIPDLLGAAAAARVTTAVTKDKDRGLAKVKEASIKEENAPSGMLARFFMLRRVRKQEEEQQQQQAVVDVEEGSHHVGHTQPGAGTATAHGGGGFGGTTVAWAPVSALRPLLARARQCAAAAAAEPPWLMSGPTDLAAWSRVLVACDALLGRVAALESLAEDHRPGHTAALGDASLAALLGLDIVAPYRRVYGQVAASCAAMSGTVAACSGAGYGRPGKPFPAVGGWSDTRERLHGLAREAMAGYWARVRGTAAGASSSSSAAAAAAAAAAGLLPFTSAGGAAPYPHPHPHPPALGRTSEAAAAAGAAPAAAPRAYLG